jgi:hypothetical protein
MKYYITIASLVMLSMNGESPITQRLNQLYSQVVNLRKDWADLTMQERATNATQEQQERKKANEDIRELLKKYQPTVDDLIIATTIHELYLMQLFLNAGVPINEKNKSQETALMAAAQHGQPEAVQFLINKGADVLARNAQGRTAKDLAYESKGLISNDVYININPGLVVAINTLSDEKRIMQTIGILARAMRAAATPAVTAPQVPQVAIPQVTLPAIPQIAMPRARL